MLLRQCLATWWLCLIKKCLSSARKWCIQRRRVCISVICLSMTSLQVVYRDDILSTVASLIRLLTLLILHIPAWRINQFHIWTITGQLADTPTRRQTNSPKLIWMFLHTDVSFQLLDVAPPHCSFWPKPKAVFRLASFWHKKKMLYCRPF